ncbi:MAG: hypothetical protein IKT93_02215 [Clostridia bacterium]|nr:hypothetical protein [Clostridia bacterium]
MITKNLAKAVEDIGFTYVEGSGSDKSHAYAIYGDYLVTVYEESGKKIAYFNFRFPESEENDLKKYDMSESFSADLEYYSVCDYYIDEDGMRVYCNGNIPDFLKLIDRCITLLKDNDIRGVEYCSKCGNKFGSRKPKKVTDGKENHLMCEHCALETVEEVANRINESNDEAATGSKAILFSTLFSLVGAFLYFVLYYWLSPAMSESGLNEIRYIFCVAGFITSMLAYFGYVFFCKKANAFTYVTVSINALLFTAIGQYIGIVFEFIAKEGFSLSALSNKHFWLVHLRNTIPADLATSFAEYNYSATFWKMLVISLCFAAVGSAIFLLSLRDKSVKKPETVEIETISIK